MANRTHRKHAGTRHGSTRTHRRTVTRTAARRSNESLASWLGDLFGTEERAPRSSRSVATRAKSTARAGSRRRAGTMSRSEAGRAGGLAPHRCRGRECNKRASRVSYR